MGLGREFAGVDTKAALHRGDIRHGLHTAEHVAPSCPGRRITLWWYHLVTSKLQHDWIRGSSLSSHSEESGLLKLYWQLWRSLSLNKTAAQLRILADRARFSPKSCYLMSCSSEQLSLSLCVYVILLKSHICSTLFAAVQGNKWFAFNIITIRSKLFSICCLEVKKGMWISF